MIRELQGQLAGALSRLDDLTLRVRALSCVADDVASGIAPLDGIDTESAQALSMALEAEVEQLHTIGDQLRVVYGYASRLAPLSRQAAMEALHAS
jgi:hypothetical protein